MGYFSFKKKVTGLQDGARWWRYLWWGGVNRKPSSGNELGEEAAFKGRVAKSRTKLATCVVSESCIKSEITMLKQ